jgi:mycoredoxin-dependent peroxiredoxin
VIAPGDPAPTFRLPDTNGTPIALDDFAGAPVLIVFLPAAFTPVCSAELAGLQRLERTASRTGAQVLAIACDSMFALRAWVESEGVAVAPLGSALVLSDFWPHGEVSRAYDAFDAERGIATRRSYLVDPAGVIRWTASSAAGVARDLDAHGSALETLAST